MKCLCKNGQNGDPEWKKSCSWSFKEAPLSASDVKTVQCKARTDQSTTTSTTSTTTTTEQPANPNTHRLCEMRNTWIPNCSNCYTYVETEDYFFNYETYDSYEEDHICTYSISTKCNPNFVNVYGYNCNDLAYGCESGGYKSYIDQGNMTSVIPLK